MKKTAGTTTKKEATEARADKYGRPYAVQTTTVITSRFMEAKNEGHEFYHSEINMAIEADGLFALALRTKQALEKALPNADISVAIGQNLKKTVWTPGEEKPKVECETQDLIEV